eukprot:6396281-Lingulodinium_polyedra.AAC.1
MPGASHGTALVECRASAMPGCGDVRLATARCWREALMLRDIRCHPRRAELEVARHMKPGVCTAWDSWPLARDEDLVDKVEIFTDGAATLVGTWPKMAARAGWAAVLLTLTPAPGGGLQHALLGVVWGPVVIGAEEEGFMGALRPTAPVAEHSAVLAAFKLICREPRLLGAS